MRKTFTAQAGRIARRGFTLTELLLVIIIIAILAAMTMTVQRSAVQSTRRERTIATIRKIDAALTSAYEKYQYRKPDVSYFIESAKERLVERFADFKLRSKDEQNLWVMGTVIQDISTRNNPWTPFLDRDNFERGIDHQFAPYILRAVMLRELLMIDFPDCLGEVEHNPVFNDTTSSPVHLEYRKWLEVLRRSAGNSPGGDISADLLYPIVMNTSPETRGTFLDRETADTNNNGIPEFVDGWGNPIRFIRWAPALPESNRQPTLAEGVRLARYRVLRRQDLAGDELDAANGADYAHELFYSEAVDSYPTSDYDFYTYFDEYYPGLLETSADPFDPMGSLNGWLLTPLIYSAGPDREYGMFPNCRPYDEEGNEVRWDHKFQRTDSLEIGFGRALAAKYYRFPGEVLPDVWSPKFKTETGLEAVLDYIGLGDWYGDQDGNTYSRDNITNHNLE